MPHHMRRKVKFENRLGMWVIENGRSSSEFRRKRCKIKIFLSKQIQIQPPEQPYRVSDSKIIVFFNRNVVYSTAIPRL